MVVFLFQWDTLVEQTPLGEGYKDTCKTFKPALKKGPFTHLRSIPWSVQMSSSWSVQYNNPIVSKSIKYFFMQTEHVPGRWNCSNASLWSCSRCSSRIPSLPGRLVSCHQWRGEFFMIMISMIFLPCKPNVYFTQTDLPHSTGLDNDNRVIIVFFNSDVFRCVLATAMPIMATQGECDASNENLRYYDDWNDASGTWSNLGEG